MRTFFAAGILSISVLAGCVGIVDTTGGDDTTNPNPDPNPNPNPNPNPDPNPNPTPTPALAATIDKSTVATELGKTETLTVSLTGSGGFAGDVTLTPSVVDAGGAAITGWTFAQTPPTVTLPADGTMMVTVAVTIPTNTVSLASTVKLDVSSTAPGISLSSAFTVANQYTITIKAGTGVGSAGHSASFPNLVKMHSGAKLIFHNADTIVHRIHSNNQGFPHEPNDLQPGANYTVTPTADDSWYCHDHDDGIVRNLSLQ